MLYPWHIQLEHDFDALKAEVRSQLEASVPGSERAATAEMLMNRAKAAVAPSPGPSK